MKTIQERLGRVFFAISLVLLCIKFGACVIHNDYKFLSYPWSWIYFALPIFFACTGWIRHVALAIAQVAVILLVAFGSLATSAPFWGLSLIIVATLVIYAYGWLTEHTGLRWIILGALYAIIFYIILRRRGANAGFKTLEWMLFLAAFFGILWMIFKDFVERVRKAGFAERDKCLQIVKEATKAARDATDIANMAIKTLERFEDSITKGEPYGK